MQAVFPGEREALRGFATYTWNLHLLDRLGSEAATNGTQLIVTVKYVA